LVANVRRKGFDAFVWLVAQSIWRERHRCVHNREALMSVALAPASLDEAKTWARAGFLPIAHHLGIRPLRPQ
jgi:hypothetical protein